MATKKTIGEVLRAAIRGTANDLMAIERLREDHHARALNPQRLDTMYEELADHRARLQGMLAMLEAVPDPRATERWRRSAEGRALERARQA